MWTASDEPYESDSDCEEQELHSYRVHNTSALSVFIGDISQ